MNRQRVFGMIGICLATFVAGMFAGVGLFRQKIGEHLEVQYLLGKDGSVTEAYMLLDILLSQGGDVAAKEFLIQKLKRDIPELEAAKYPIDSAFSSESTVKYARKVLAKAETASTSSPQ